MDALLITSGILTVLLAGYLFFALLYPERLQ
jgi:K+-transporting ATPase KdpF subunit